MDATRSSSKGFTLIELLIVVAIIAILAAIAVPNFLEAQVRSKISRGQADMRSLATALEVYRLDMNSYPPDENAGNWYGMVPWGIELLTTPIAYITSIPRDPFYDKARVESDPSEDAYYYRYYCNIMWKTLQDSFPPAPPYDRKDEGYLWVLCTHGPDNQWSCGEYAMYSQYWLVQVKAHFGGNDGAIYDATNGTISEGDIVRVGP